LVFRVVIEHSVAYWAYKELEIFVTFVDKFAGKLLLYEANFVHSADGRIRILEFEAPFGHWRSVGRG